LEQAPRFRPNARSKLHGYPEINQIYIFLDGRHHVGMMRR
jgi:hypothetical protein